MVVAVRVRHTAPEEELLLELVGARFEASHLASQAVCQRVVALKRRVVALNESHRSRLPRFSRDPKWADHPAVQIPTPGNKSVTNIPKNRGKLKERVDSALDSAIRYFKTGAN